MHEKNHAPRLVHLIFGAGVILSLMLSFAVIASDTQLGGDQGATTAHYDLQKAWGRYDFLAHRALRQAGTTRAQRRAIDARVETYLNELTPAMNRHLEIQAGLRQAWSDPVVDAERLEALRVEQVQLADQTSRRVLEMAIEIADELDPEQRLAVVTWLDDLQRMLLQ